MMRFVIFNNQRIFRYKEINKKFAHRMLMENIAYITQYLVEKIGTWSRRSEK